MDRVRPNDDASSSGSLDRAAELWAAGESDEAKTLIHSLAFGAWARRAEAMNLVRAARMLAEIGDVQDALRFVEACFGRGVRTPDLQLIGARLSVRRSRDAPQERVERLRYAEHQLRALLADYPSDPRGNALLGLVCEQQGRVQEGIEAWRCAHVLDPEDLDHRVGLAVALCSAGRFREAVPLFQRVAEARGGRADAHVNLGLALRESGELERALLAFKEAAALSPRSARIHVDLGLTLRGMGRLAAAIEAFERAIELEPDRAEAYHQVGRALLREGRQEEAVKALEEARQRAPNDRALQRTLLELARMPKHEDVVTVSEAAALTPHLVADLSRFAVPELVEFLGMGRRTGILELETPEESAELEFLEGRLLSGRLDRQPTFLEAVIAEGIWVPSGLADAEYGRGAGPVLETLLEEGIGDRSIYGQLAFESSVRTIIDLLQISEGSAEFHGRLPGAPGQDSRLLDLATDAQGVLLEAFRRVDEAAHSM